MKVPLPIQAAAGIDVRRKKKLPWYYSRKLIGPALALLCYLISVPLQVKLDSDTVTDAVMKVIDNWDSIIAAGTILWGAALPFISLIRDVINAIKRKRSGEGAQAD